MKCDVTGLLSRNFFITLWKTFRAMYSILHIFHTAHSKLGGILDTDPYRHVGISKTQTAKHVTTKNNKKLHKYRSPFQLPSKHCLL